MNRIRDLRIMRGWLQDDLAKQINLSRQTVSCYENETRSIDIETIHRLCDIFGVTADYLLCRSDMPTPQISAEDWALLAAYHQADERARQMVALALEPWAEKKESPAAV